MFWFLELVAAALVGIVLDRAVEKYVEKKK
jgi:hypothetical protein